MYMNPLATLLHICLFPIAQVGGAGVEPSAAQDLTIPELFAHLSSCSPPSVANLATIRGLTCAITTLAVSSTTSGD